MRDSYVLFPENRAYLANHQGLPRIAPAISESEKNLLIFAMLIAVIVLLVMLGEMRIIWNWKPTVATLILRRADTIEDMTEYQFTYRYTVDGVTHQQEATVMFWVYNGYMVSDLLPILYDPAHPESSTVVDNNRIVKFIVFVVAVLIIRWVMSLIRRERERTQLSKQGRLVMGVFIHIERLKTPKDNKEHTEEDEGLKLKVRFKSPDDLSMIEGERSYIGKYFKTLKPPYTGDDAAIFYLDKTHWEIL